ncbi:MAG: GTPase [Caulobacteraceae bacterium]
MALVGAPNAGKSRLFNALLGREAVIVTEIAGTTRDVVEAPLALAGYKALLADMAGVREAADAIEAEGVKRARDWARLADLRIWVVDGAGGEGAWEEAKGLLRRGDILALNKSDLAMRADAAAAARHAACLGAERLDISASTGRGVEALAEKIETRMVDDLSGADFPAVTRERHERLLAEALAHLNRAAEHLEAPELAAEDVRLSTRALERIAGRIGAEDVLDAIFASFCIGK